MTTPKQLKRQLDDLIAHLVEIGLANDQNYPFKRRVGSHAIEISFPGANHLSIVLKNERYDKIYQALRAERAYSVLMSDGAMLQMNYMFKDGKLERHRLAFLPSPFLLAFQNYPEIYLEDSVYAEIIGKGVVPFPIRFDFDDRKEVFEEINHPKSHLTLGQYQNCRIPVSAALTPASFVEFILQNFYHTDFRAHAELLPQFTERFEETLADVERSVVHMIIPSNTP